MFREIYLQTGFQLELIFRLVLAAFLGVFIGFERRNRNKMAGIRTHAIVAFGAALMMIVSKYGFADMGKFDGSRVAAQIVSGVGFLGAGIIFVRNNTLVSGLTTAAGVWTTAGVGMCVGSGLYLVSVASGLLLIGMQEGLHRIRFFSEECCRARIKLQYRSSKLSIQEIERFIQGQKVVIESLNLNKEEKEAAKLEMLLLFPSLPGKTELLDKLANQNGVISVKG